MALSPGDLESLDTAVRLLEFPTFASRVAEAIGTPVRLALDRIPSGSSRLIVAATHAAVNRAFSVALSTMDAPRFRPSQRMHMLASVATGLVGGAFGLPALFIELPTSTIIMLRAIAEIAREEGEYLGDTEGRLACMEVFALGTRGHAEDPGDAYFTMRTMLAAAITEAAAQLSQHGLARETLPALIKLLAQIGTRFGIVVSEKVAAQAVPIIGAIGGAGLNALFMNHFQDVARGHFTVRRLERRYGRRTVENVYNELRRGYQRPHERFSAADEP
jgi:EcsC protein family